MRGNAVAVFEVAEELVERFDSTRLDILETFANGFDRLFAFWSQNQRFLRRDAGRLIAAKLFADKLVEAFEWRGSLVDAHGIPGIATI
jgi:hypothetical protein